MYASDQRQAARYIQSWYPTSRLGVDAFARTRIASPPHLEVEYNLMHRKYAIAQGALLLHRVTPDHLRNLETRLDAAENRSNLKLLGAVSNEVPYAGPPGSDAPR